MEKFTSKSKMSKKNSKEMNKLKRKTWGDLNPVTKVVVSKKIYNRKKIRKNMSDNSDFCGFVLFVLKFDFN